MYLIDGDRGSRAKAILSGEVVERIEDSRFWRKV